MAKKRYFIDCDDDGHWYLVNVNHREEWDEWLNQDWKNELASFQTPHYAREIDSTDSISFSDPEDE